MTKEQRKLRWMRYFQRYCISDEIQEESSLNGINACGYGIQCDECADSGYWLACAKSMIDYAKSKNFEIDYENTSTEYFRELLEGKIK